MEQGARVTFTTSRRSSRHCAPISPTRSFLRTPASSNMAMRVGLEPRVGRVPYENWNVIDRHGYLRWRPVEADTPLRDLHWFWHPNDEKSAEVTR